ncbi:hypothetical protein BKA70DRAFT_1491810 [Coprinopsis sp. MPI-PUGE-AT-0042]|nr:hypothetical protein BKA70DRAFT_1491810 [Coprinopsis sp. MPI-PUGE-AT-0042]
MAKLVDSHIAVHPFIPKLLPGLIKTLREVGHPTTMSTPNLVSMSLRARARRVTKACRNQPMRLVAQIPNIMIAMTPHPPLPPPRPSHDSITEPSPDAKVLLSPLSPEWGADFVGDDDKHDAPASIDAALSDGGFIEGTQIGRDTDNVNNNEGELDDLGLADDEDGSNVLPLQASLHEAQGHLFSGLQHTPTFEHDHPTPLAPRPFVPSIHTIDLTRAIHIPIVPRSTANDDGASSRCVRLDKAIDIPIDAWIVDLSADVCRRASKAGSGCEKPTHRSSSRLSFPPLLFEPLDDSSQTAAAKKHSVKVSPGNIDVMCNPNLATNPVNIKNSDVPRWDLFAPYLEIVSSKPAGVEIACKGVVKSATEDDEEGHGDEDEEEGEDLYNCQFSFAYSVEILLNTATLRLKQGHCYGLCG